MYKRFLKRSLDIGLAGCALLVLSPLLALVALAIRLEDSGPVFFVQERVGRDGRKFRLIKFRSMPVETRDVPSANAASLAVTRVGRIIRRTNIDELPQLINILRGDMSIVGPRPALPAQGGLLDLRAGNGAAACRPGLTGAAQVNSYDGMSDAEKARWDGWYSEHVGFVTDLRIILRTFVYLMRPPPAY